MDESLGARPKVSTDARGNIEQLPDEVLEYVFKLVSPYGDFQSCSRVNQRWRRICLQACRSKLHSFYNQVSQGELLWNGIHPNEHPESISKRHSHCCVYHAGTLSMYVFGGCTSNSSTFNDLLQFNLSTRTWSRPRAIGMYPSPKALATLVENERSLILFGGWTDPSPYPLTPPWRLFSELHIYDLQENRWSQITKTNPNCPEGTSCLWPPPTAGHSATMHRNNMVVFGGLQKEREYRFLSSPNVWVFSSSKLTWTLKTIEGEKKPSGRYGQSQIYLDDDHLLIIGGCVGTDKSELHDVWLLEMKDEAWRWIEMRVEGAEHRGKDILRHPACRVTKDRVVVLGKSKVTVKKPSSIGQAANIRATSTQQITRNAIGSVPLSIRNAVYYNSSSSEENEPAVEAERGMQPDEGVADREVHGAEAGPSRGFDQRMSGLNEELNRQPVKPKQRMLENRQRQLASLNRMEERIRNYKATNPSKPQPTFSPPVLCPNHRMALSVLDTSRAISDHVVTWLPPSPLLPDCRAPQECILYSLVKGRGELIMFGGLKKDIGLGSLRDNSQSTVTNSVYILHPRIENI